ncbi:MAG: hypothetical protein LBR22_01845 [Desulfovibrio sp.]|jgi:hypothetical protein|nr:hypothetical protein [Desulfovibrio sp.]
MRFLYSRKPQLLLLLIWFLGLAFLFGVITKGDISFFRTPVVSQTAPTLGSVPMPKEPTATAEPPAKVRDEPGTAGDPILNHSTALRIIPNADGDGHVLVLELDYVPAATKGFTLNMAKCYYIESPPAFVIALGEPWRTDLQVDTSFHADMRQVRAINVILTHSRNHRLIVSTRSEEQARMAHAQLSATGTGLKAEIYFPR